MDVYFSQCAARNPFRVVELPLAARLYRYRKGSYRRRSAGQRILRLLAPSGLFLRAVLGLAGRKARGIFTFERGANKRQISFRVANTQFHALYFPQYAGGYEPETTCLVDAILATMPRGVFYDVGANWGYYSLFAASAPGFAGQVHAFEPFPATFSDLSSVVRQAGLEETISCHELALAGENRAAKMSFHDGVTSGTAAVTSNLSGVSMRMAALDSLSLPPPDLMKVDVEGLEPEVFSGAARTLAAVRPMIVFESWFRAARGAEGLRPLQILAEHGYRFFRPALARIESEQVRMIEFCNWGLAEAPSGLALQEFALEQRPLLPTHLNVFACHKSRCEEFLNAAFTRRISGGEESRRLLRAA